MRVFREHPHWVVSLAICSRILETKIHRFPFLLIDTYVTIHESTCCKCCNPSLAERFRPRSQSTVVISGALVFFRRPRRARRSFGWIDSISNQLLLPSLFRCSCKCGEFTGIPCDPGVQSLYFARVESNTSLRNTLVCWREEISGRRVKSLRSEKEILWPMEISIKPGWLSLHTYSTSARTVAMEVYLTFQRVMSCTYDTIAKVPLRKSRILPL